MEDDQNLISKRCGSSPPHWRKLPEKQALGGSHSPMYAPRSLFLHDCYKRATDDIMSPPLKRFNIIWTASETEMPSIAPDAVHGNWQCIWGCHQSGQKERKHSGWAAAASQSLDKKGRLTHSLTVTGCQGRCSLRHLYLKADGAIHVEFYLNRIQEKFH